MTDAMRDLSEWLKTSEPQPVDDEPSTPAPQPDQGGERK